MPPYRKALCVNYVPVPNQCPAQNGANRASMRITDWVPKGIKVAILVNLRSKWVAEDSVSLFIDNDARKSTDTYKLSHQPIQLSYSLGGKGSQKRTIYYNRSYDTRLAQSPEANARSPHIARGAM